VAGGKNQTGGGGWGSFTERGQKLQFDEAAKKEKQIVLKKKVGGLMERVLLEKTEKRGLRTPEAFAGKRLLRRRLGTGSGTAVKFFGRLGQAF